MRAVRAAIGFLALLLPGLVLTDGAAASTPPQVTPRTCGAMDPGPLLERSYNFNRTSDPDAPLEIPTKASRFDGAATLATLTDPKARPSDVTQAPSSGRVIFILSRPQKIAAPDWLSSYGYGAAETDPNDRGAPRSRAAIGVSIKERTAEQAMVEVSLPRNERGVQQQKWTIVAVLCGGDENKILGYGSTKIEVVSTDYAWRMAVGGVLLFWLALAIATWQLYGQKLRDLWSSYPNFVKDVFGEGPNARRAWLIICCINPLFISQNSLGFASLSRFQILIFTTAVGFVLLYVYMHSAVLSELSQTILILLGVTLTGGTLARAVGDGTGLSQASRTLLNGALILKPDMDRPRWKDLFETQGEIDVAKVQAFIFTGLITLAILASGYHGLTHFYLPEQTVALALVSQVAYVGGKVVPVETRRELERELAALRTAAANQVSWPTDPGVASAYQQARQAARIALEQTYADKFDAIRYDRVTSDAVNVATPAAPVRSSASDPVPSPPDPVRPGG